MARVRRFLLRLLSSFRSRRAEGDLRREIASHLHLLEEDFIARGMSTEDARYAARRAFGGVEQVKERQRDARSFTWMNGLSLDLRLGVRMLVKYPGLTLVGGAALTLAIGIGAAAFALFYASVHPTLPLDEGDDIVGLENLDTSWNNQEDRILHDFVEWRRDLTTIRDLAAVQMLARNIVDPQGHPQSVSVAEMTASGFHVARVPPLLGRPLVDEDERSGAPLVIVLGYELWQRRFGADPLVVGRSVRLGSSTHTVVGVMPDGFGFPLNARAWIPLRGNPSDYPRRRGPNLVVFGRLGPGATLDGARAELDAVGQHSAAAFPQTHQRLRPRIVRYTELWFDDEPRAAGPLLLVVVALLVVVVGVNVAILVYARTATRLPELVMRTALGASRRRIIGQLFVEALVLSSFATVAGLLLARFTLWQVRETAEIVAGRYGGVPFWMEFGLSWSTGLFVVGLAVLAAVIAGVLPAIQATGRRLPSLGQLGAGNTIRIGPVWTGLVAAQVGFAVTVLPLATFLTLQWIDLARADPGFNPEAFLVTRIDIDEEQPPADRARAYHEDLARRYEARFVELVTRLENEPDVAAVTTMSMEPGSESIRSLEVEGPAGAQNLVEVRHVRVGANFFDTFGVPLLAGRSFDAADLASREQRNTESHAVIVNRTFASQVFAAESPLGRRVRYTGRDSSRQTAHWHEIVGVVGDLPANPLSPDGVQARVYHVAAPGREYWTKVAIQLRARSPEHFAPRLRELAAQVDPAIQLARTRTLPEVYREEQLWLRWGAFGLSAVTLSVLVLSAAGIYALMSLVVSRRSREIGIRLALGAERRQILWTIFARAASQLALGVVAGLTIAGLAAIALGGDPARWATVLSGVAIFITLVGMLAAFGPARRGLRVNPTEALRQG